MYEDGKIVKIVNEYCKTLKIHRNRSLLKVKSKFFVFISESCRFHFQSSSCKSGVILDGKAVVNRDDNK